jgi:CBS domain-containing membrane protein
VNKQLQRRFRTARVIFYKETLIDLREHFWTFIGSFTGIAIIGLIHSDHLTINDNIFIIGSFGASSVLIYGIINSPLAQPRNVIGGHVISALIGVTIYKLIPNELWLSSALSVSLSIVAMQMTKTLHPPGGATALIANTSSEKIHTLGFLYVFSPVLTGVLILILVAIVFNNATPHRRYPQNKSWYKIWKRNYRPKKPK